MTFSSSPAPKAVFICDNPGVRVRARNGLTPPDIRRLAVARAGSRVGRLVYRSRSGLSWGPPYLAPAAAPVTGIRGSD
ncbi:MAG: hypothetical protein ACYC9H_03870 [Sulfuricaulis sp.]